MAEPLTLMVLQSPDVPLRGELLTVSAPGGIIGRSPLCGVCLADTRVSRQHARLVCHGGRWSVIDLASSGGTFINGVQIEGSTGVPLTPGDLIDIGPWRMRVHGDGTRTWAVEQTMATIADDRMGSPASVARRPTQRLEAMSSCIDQLVRTRNEGELARAVLRSAIEGTGFRRGAMLRLTQSVDQAEVLASLSLERGVWKELESGELTVPTSLLRTAGSGNTAVVDAQQASVSESMTIAEQSIHSAVCAPVRLEGRVVAMLYVDSRGGESPIKDSASFCEDLAQLYGLAIAYAAKVDLERRQGELRNELERARVLRSMLAPADLVCMAGYRVAHAMVAGSYVSGDMFDAHMLSDGVPAVLFGDATGHGVGAAMLTALAQSHLHAELAHCPSVLDAVLRTNKFIAERDTGGAFISLWAARLEPRGSIEYVDAGHGHWLIVRSGGIVEVAPAASGPPMGVLVEAGYMVGRAQLEPGDRLVLYTDGVCEALDSTGEQFGQPGICAALSVAAGCEEDVELVLALVKSNGVQLADDATVMSIQWIGSTDRVE